MEVRRRKKASGLLQINTGFFRFCLGGFPPYPIDWGDQPEELENTQLSSAAQLITYTGGNLNLDELKAH